MNKMWHFSTLQRPTQEEKERKRRYREELKRQEQKAKGRNVGRAKTFRQERQPLSAAPTSSGNIMDALKYRAKSASRVDQNDNIMNFGIAAARRREHSANAAARLRFMDNEDYHVGREPRGQPRENKLRWFDRDEPLTSSGYSSGGGGDRGRFGRYEDNRELSDDVDAFDVGYYENKKGNKEFNDKPR